MLPEQKLKELIITLCASREDFTPIEMNASNIDGYYDELVDDDEYCDCLHDTKNELRTCGLPTGLRCDDSRNYDSDSVALECAGGVWVGFTYWTGGGKHGEPEAIGWMEHAYYLDCKEEEVMTTKRTFTKKGQ